MNNFQIDMAFKNNKKVAFTSKVMKNSQLMDYMLSLHFIDIRGCFG
jgi:hypothetical protein